MKKVFVLAIVLGCSSQLVSCGSTSRHVTKVNPIQTTSKSFAQWCQQKKSVPVSTRTTIDILLKEVGTNDCQLADAKLKSLTNLDLYHNQITDLQPLAGLINLTSLDLIGNQITDVRPLAGLINLTFLSLSENQIVEVEPLAGLDKLTFLGLRKNRISNIKPLARLSNLVNLDLEGNSFAKQLCPVVPENICSF